MRSAVDDQNLAAILAAYARFNSGQRTADDLEIWHEEGEFHSAAEDPEFSIHRGIGAIRDHYASWVDAYPNLRLEPVEACGREDTVFLWLSASGQARQSGVPLGMELGHVITLRDGRITRLLVYTNRSEALRAAGLPECAEPRA
jgi:ketosteroid isomerase-like protein